MPKKPEKKGRKNALKLPTYCNLEHFSCLFFQVFLAWLLLRGAFFVPRSALFCGMALASWSIFRAIFFAYFVDFFRVFWWSARAARALDHARSVGTFKKSASRGFIVVAGYRWC